MPTGTATAEDLQAKIMLDTASFLNSQLQMSTDQRLQKKTMLKTNKINGLKTVLQDIKDATETYNREFIEREKALKNNPNEKTFTNLQDWSLFIMFGGYAVFSVFIFIYIIRFSKAPLLLGASLIIISAIMITLITFIIQTYG
jgi:hypothetical protein